MTLEERLRQGFAEDTAYERLLLATIIDPSKPPPGTVFATNDIRGTGQRSFAESLSMEWISRPSGQESRSKPRSSAGQSEPTAVALASLADF